MINVLRTVKINKLYKLSHFKKIFFDKINLVGKTQNPEESLDRTFKWIKSSFEATPDKGSSAYYRFSTGWQGSYPETTGYLIPTLYEYSKYKNKPEYALIAKEAADWLIDIQTKEGGLQGLHIGKNCEPRVFNSGMINVISNLIFIPIFGIEAAAITTMAALLYLGFRGLALKSFKEKCKINMYGAYWIIAIVGMTMLVYLLSDLNIIIKLSITILYISLIFVNLKRIKNYISDLL